MPFLIIPNEVTTSSATVWVGCLDQPISGVSLECDGQRLDLKPSDWQSLDPADPSVNVFFQSVKIDGLALFKPYALSLRDSSDNVVANASLKTLPEDLPNLTDTNAFTVLLGSCFYWKEDKGASSATFSRIPANAKPDIKILCGDQVYLDSPYYNFIASKHNRNELRELFLNTYRRTWAEVAGAITLNTVLRAGGNFYAPDDHEFWNNAPTSAVVVRDSHDAGTRSEWLALAKRFYEVFQGKPKPFTVEPVSFFIADTRSNRSADNQQFMNDPDLKEIEDWLGNLHGPGILCVGQPVFDRPGGFFAKWTDFGLPDFKQQYARLVRAINAAQHDVVIITGDVHYGRVATCRLASGVEVIEIISSPMSLVEAPLGIGGGHWKPAPDSLDVPGSPAISTDHTFGFARNHFLTLEFRADGVGAQLTVRDWPFKPDGSPTSLPGRVILDRPLR